MNHSELFWTNIQLLGFDFEHQQDCVFEVDMFKRNGSVKGVNIVLQFLLSRIDPQQAKEDFKGIWPLLDKGQEKDFRRVCLSRLQRMEQDGVLPPDSVRLSDLTSGRGERLCSLLHRLSQVALHRHLQRNRRSVPMLAICDASLMPLFPRLLRASAMRLRAMRLRFLRTAASGAAALKALKTAAQSLPPLPSSSNVAPVVQKTLSKKGVSINNNNVSSSSDPRVSKLREAWKRLQALPSGWTQPQLPPPLKEKDLRATAEQFRKKMIPKGSERAMEGLKVAVADRSAHSQSLRQLASRMEKTVQKMQATTDRQRLVASASRVARTHAAFDAALSPRKKLQLDDTENM